MRQAEMIELYKKADFTFLEEDNKDCTDFKESLDTYENFIETLDFNYYNQDKL